MLCIHFPLILFYYFKVTARRKSSLTQCLNFELYCATRLDDDGDLEIIQIQLVNFGFENKLAGYFISGCDMFQTILGKKGCLLIKKIRFVFNIKKNKHLDVGKSNTVENLLSTLFKMCLKKTYFTSSI